jgi:hypothetical protein
MPVLSRSIVTGNAANAKARTVAAAMLVAAGISRPCHAPPRGAVKDVELKARSRNPIVFRSFELLAAATILNTSSFAVNRRMTEVQIVAFCPPRESERYGSADRGGAT